MAKNSDRLILVTGATGHQGSAVLRHLREKQFAVRAMTRDANSPTGGKLMHPGGEVVSGDLNDPDSVARAVSDCFGVYSVQAMASPDEEIKQGKTLIDAANRADVSHFVYSSAHGADANTGVPHFESKGQIETHLRNSGLAYTIFRPASFMENWLGQRDQILQNGALSLPLKPETLMQLVSTDDIGAFVTRAFEKTGHWNNRAFDLAGDQLSVAQIAAELGRASNQEIKYNQVPWDAFEQAAGSDLTKMFRSFEEPRQLIDIAAVRAEDPQLLTFERWLAKYWPAKQ